MERNSPKIYIYVTEQAAPFCKPMQLGMEEEGIESNIVSIDQKLGIQELQDICLEQCVSGPMGIAIVFREDIKIYVKGLAAKPLFTYDLPLEVWGEKKLFLIGKNAARFVKRKPFLEVDKPMKAEEGEAYETIQ